MQSRKETAPTVTPAPRRPWEKPRLKRMKASGAETRKISPSVDGLQHS